MHTIVYVLHVKNESRPKTHLRLKNTTPVNLLSWFTWIYMDQPELRAYMIIDILCYLYMITQEWHGYTFSNINHRPLICFYSSRIWFKIRSIEESNILGQTKEENSSLNILMSTMRSIWK